jgi:TolB-like protein
MFANDPKRTSFTDTGIRSHSEDENAESYSSTALSRFPDLAVVARNSSFAYKGKTVDMRQVGKELGVGTRWSRRNFPKT